MIGNRKILRRPCIVGYICAGQKFKTMQTVWKWLFVQDIFKYIIRIEEFGKMQYIIYIAH